MRALTWKKEAAKALKAPAGAMAGLDFGLDSQEAAADHQNPPALAST